MTLVCFALKEEAAPFRKIAAGNKGISILIVGIGCANAEKSVRSFLDDGARTVAVCQDLANREQLVAGPARLAGTLAPPDLVLTCGFAGGLNPELKIGDVIFESGKQKAESRNLEERLLAAGAKPAKFACADRIATTAAEKKKLREQTGVDAVEMESAAIQAVCAERGIPCATVRVISDTAHEDLPLDFNALAKPDRNLDYGKLFLAIAKSPGKIGALMQLQKKTTFAAESLAAVLMKLI